MTSIPTRSEGSAPACARARPTTPALPAGALAACLALVASTAARADDLELGSANSPPGTGVLVPVSLVGDNPVVAVQFVLAYPESHVETGPPVVSSTSSNHRAQSSDDLEGLRRVVVFSPTNAELPPDLAVSLPLRLLPSSPVGGPSLGIDQIVFTDALGNAFPAAARYSVAETWRKAKFTDEQREDPTVIGDDRDPDEDGIPNIDELSRGTDPNAADAGAVARSVIEVDGEGRLVLALRFLRAADPAVRDAAPGIVESSLDLENWRGEDLAAAEPTGEGTATSEEVEMRLPVDDDARRFVRIRSVRAEGQ